MNKQRETPGQCEAFSQPASSTYSGHTQGYVTKANHANALKQIAKLEQAMRLLEITEKTWHESLGAHSKQDGAC